MQRKRHEGKSRRGEYDGKKREREEFGITEEDSSGCAISRSKSQRGDAQWSWGCGESTLMRTKTNGGQMICDSVEETGIQNAPHAGAHES